MRIKLDENITHALVLQLTLLGHDVDTVQAERLEGRPDAEVWAAAQAERRFLITQDLDFSDARRYQPGSHEGLLLIRLANPGREALTQRLVHLFRSEAVDTWTGCLVVASDRKIRIRRPARDK
jgi:predicted nuclease of predicted toxin-antitoxin system